MGRWQLVDDPAGAAIEYAGCRATIEPDARRCLGTLVDKLAEGASLPELHGFVVSIRLLGDGARCSEVGARAVIRALRTAFARVGLDDMIVEHERFGYKLRLPPDDDVGPFR